jgi:hypothetical protein
MIFKFFGELMIAIISSSIPGSSWLSQSGAGSVPQGRSKLQGCCVSPGVSDAFLGQSDNGRIRIKHHVCVI